jgi:hypothetical protein
MSRYAIMVIVRLHEEEGSVHFSLLRAQNRFVFGAFTNMFQEHMWIFAAPDPAVLDIDLTAAMKHAVITESYGVQKSLIALYPMKYLYTEFLTNHLICIRKELNDR